MKKSRKPAFLHDEEMRAISKTAFRRMGKEQKRELMLQWFFENFENPAESLPYESAEGGYQWIWGGPYEAREQIQMMFEGIVSDRLIEDVLNQLESESYEWSPVQKNEDWEDLDWDKRLDEPQDLGIYLDEPSPLYGSPQEQEARNRAIKVLGHLEAALNKHRAVGIGHNQPPEELEAEEIGKLRQAAVELKVEFSRESPSIEVVKRETSLFRDALIAASKWATKKADKAADAAAGVAGVGFGGWLLSKIPAIQTAFNAIIDWLEVAAKTVF